jgi:hypothetical protein
MTENTPPAPPASDDVSSYLPSRDDDDRLFVDVGINMRMDVATTKDAVATYPST